MEGRAPAFAFRCCRVLPDSLRADQVEVPSDDADLRIVDRSYLDWVRDTRGVYWVLDQAVLPPGTPLCDRHPIVWDEAAGALRRVLHDGGTVPR